MCPSHSGTAMGCNYKGGRGGEAAAIKCLTPCRTPCPTRLESPPWLSSSVPSRSITTLLQPEAPDFYQFQRVFSVVLVLRIQDGNKGFTALLFN